MMTSDEQETIRPMYLQMPDSCPRPKRLSYASPAQTDSIKYLYLHIPTIMNGIATNHHPCRTDANINISIMNRSMIDVSIVILLLSPISVGIY